MKRVRHASRSCAGKPIEHSVWTGHDAGLSVTPDPVRMVESSIGHLGLLYDKFNLKPTLYNPDNV